MISHNISTFAWHRCPSPPSATISRHCWIYGYTCTRSSSTPGTEPQMFKSWARSRGSFVASRSQRLEVGNIGHQKEVEGQIKAGVRHVVYPRTRFLFRGDRTSNCRERCLCFFTATNLCLPVQRTWLVARSGVIDCQPWAPLNTTDPCPSS